MNRVGTLVSLPVLCLWAAVSPGQPTKGFSQEHVKQWKNAGVQVGWYGLNKYGMGKFYKDRPNDVEVLPALRWETLPPGAVAKLPAPAVPFALDLEFTTDVEAWLADLAGFAQLRVLSLGSTKVTDAGLKKVAALKNLQSLHLWQCREVTHAGLKEIKALHDLQTLNLFNTEVTDLGLKEVGGMGSLRTLNLCQCSEISDAGLKELATLQRLQTLTLFNNRQLTDAGLKHLAAMKSLQTVDLGITKLSDAGLKEFAHLKDLRFLNVAVTRVTDEGVAVLQRALPNLEVEK